MNRILASLMLALSLVLAVAAPSQAQRVFPGYTIFVPTNRPSTPDEGTVYQSQTDHKFYIYSGSAWVAVGSVASGATIDQPKLTGQWTINGSLCASQQLLQGGNPATCTSTPIARQIDLQGTGTLNSISMFFPAADYFQAVPLSSTNGGVNLAALTKVLNQSAYELDLFGGPVGGTGGASIMSAPLLQYTFFTTFTGGGIVNALGRLATWTNFNTGDFASWCQTDQVDCTTTVSSGTRTYLFDFSLGANSRLKGAIVNASTESQINGATMVSATAPTVSAGFGSSVAGTVTRNTGTLAVQVTVGTNSGGTTGTLTFPTAPTGWACTLSDVTNTADLTRQTGFTTTTAAFSTTVAWTSADKLVGICAPF